MKDVRTDRQRNLKLRIPKEVVKGFRRDERYGMQYRDTDGQTDATKINKEPAAVLSTYVCTSVQEDGRRERVALGAVGTGQGARKAAKTKVVIY